MSVKNFACLCGGGLGNLGVPACVTRGGLIKKDIFMNTFATDGTRNAILATDFVDGVLPSSYLLGKFTEADPSKRWYITPDTYEEADPTRTDRTTQESATGTIKILRNGQLNRAFELWEVPHSWAAKLNKSTCNEVSVLSVDEKGQLIGEVSQDGTEFYGLLVQKDSLRAEAFEAGPAKDAYTSINYQISRDSEEGLFLTIGADQTQDNMLTAKSLIEVDLTQGTGTNTNTEIYIDAFNGTYGTFQNEMALQGFTDPTDWKVFTSAGTEGVEITISAVEEVETGKYKLTLAVDAATTVYVSFVKVKTDISSIGYVADQVTITKP